MHDFEGLNCLLRKALKSVHKLDRGGLNQHWYWQTLLNFLIIHAQLLIRANTLEIMTESS
jgi:hypothetical protein